MKRFLPLAALAALFAGCASPLPQKTVRIESDPPGARVFISTAVNATSAALGKDYLGTTPCEWTTTTRRNGGFILPEGPFGFTPGVIIFSAEPPHGDTNLVSARQIFHGEAHFIDEDKVPSGIFFDLHRKP